MAPHRLSKTHRIIAAAAVAAMMASCGTGHGEFSLWQDLPHRGWAYGDTLVLAPDTARTGTEPSQGRLSVAVAHDDRFPYANLWIEVTTSAGRDTVELELADVYGRWQGKGLGASYQMERDLGHRTLSMTSPVTVRHVMRTDTLEGINSIGVKFVKD